MSANNTLETRFAKSTKGSRRKIALIACGVLVALVFVVLLILSSRQEELFSTMSIRDQQTYTFEFPNVTVQAGADPGFLEPITVAWTWSEYSDMTYSVILEWPVGENAQYVEALPTYTYGDEAPLPWNGYLDVVLMDNFEHLARVRFTNGETEIVGICPNREQRSDGFCALGQIIRRIYYIYLPLVQR